MAATDSAAIEVVSPEGRSAGLRDRLPPAATSRSKGRRPRVARMKRLHGFPARAMFDAAHAEWGRRYRLIDQPDDISLGGVRLHLSEPWATPEIRRAIYEGWYEQTERTILQHTLRPDDHYLEVGAGTGLVTTCACKIVGAEKVVAYEGDPRLANQARETAARNGFVADVVNAVLGAGDGETTFYVDADFRASSLLALENAREIRVQFGHSRPHWIATGPRISWWTSRAARSSCLRQHSLRTCAPSAWRPTRRSPETKRSKRCSCI